MTENTTAGGELAGLRVMVIDDSKTIRRTAETLLKREGCEVVTATDGFEALAKIADQQPQIIFVDIMMPRLDGYQTCALIKGNQLFKATPVIMLSSKDGLFDKARGRIVGSEQYLTKPFTREELLAFYEGKTAKWQIPDDVVFVDAIPLGATGKMQKMTLRQQLKDYVLPGL